MDASRPGVSERPLGGGRVKIENPSGPIPGNLVRTISGGEEVLARKWGGLFLGYLLGKNFRRRVIAISYPFGREHGRPLAVKRREFIALLGDDACDRFLHPGGVADAAAGS
jgi:hypothetical protein